MKTDTEKIKQMSAELNKTVGGLYLHLRVKTKSNNNTPSVVRRGQNNRHVTKTGRQNGILVFNLLLSKSRESSSKCREYSPRQI